MKTIIHPGNPIIGSLPHENNLDLPGDKSLSHRAALFAAIADGKSMISNFQVSGVTRPLLNALKQLGVDWQLEGTNLTVNGRGFEGLNPASAPINCGNSATTLRLLAGALAASGIPAILDGSDGLRRRPMDRIVQPLQRMGVPIKACERRMRAVNPFCQRQMPAPAQYSIYIAGCIRSGKIMPVAGGTCGQWNQHTLRTGSIPRPHRKHARKYGR